MLLENISDGYTDDKRTEVNGRLSNLSCFTPTLQPLELSDSQYHHQAHSRLKRINSEGCSTISNTLLQITARYTNTRDFEAITMTRKLVLASASEATVPDSDGSKYLRQHLLEHDASSTLERPSWATLSTATSHHKRNHHTIPAAHGFAFTVPAHTSFRIVDLHGQQVVDLMAWALPFSTSTASEHFSTSYTRYNLKGMAPPQEGEYLYTNHDRKMIKVVEDKVKCHDMLFMACNPGFYQRLGKEGHRSCASNMAEAMNEWIGHQKPDERAVAGDETAEFKWYQVHDPFNTFQNTPYYTLKALECSRKGDYIEMRAEMDCVIALSSCPYMEDGFNGGKVTDVGVVWEGGR